MSIKKLLAMCCTGAMLLTFASCGGSGSGSSSGSSTASKTQSAVSSSTVAVSSDNVSSEYQAPQADVVEAVYRNSSYNKKVKNLKILPVGDSLCFGQGALSGWRYALFEELYSAGVTFEFVGPFSSTRDYRLTDRYNKHAGVSGRTIEGVLSDFNNIFNRDFDAVVLMIGYNNKSTIDSTYSTYDQLINKIYQKNPNAVLFLSAVAPDMGGDKAFTNFNKHIEELCASLTKSGKKAYYMPMNKGNYDAGTCYTDYVHFNETGNRTIAANMADVMTDVLLKMNTADSSYTLPVSPTGIKLDKTAVSLTAGININQSVALTATVSPNNAAVKNVTWMTGNSNVATVDAYGRVTAVGRGKCTITAKTLDGGKAATCEVTVTEDTSPAASTVFSDSFSSTSNWTGHTNHISGNSFNTTWQDNASTFKITTTSSYNATDNFALSMRYFVYSNEETVKNNNFVSMSFEKFELRVGDCMRNVTLYYDGKEIGSYTAAHPTVEKHTFMLRYNKGEVSVLMSGETIITAKQKMASTDSTITIVNKEISRSVTLTPVKLVKF